MEKSKWGIGAKIWFGLMILGQWISFINEITKRSPSSQAEIVYFIVGAIGTVLYLWLAISKSKAALITILVVAGINFLVNLFSGAAGVAFAGLIAPAITFLIARNKVFSAE